MDERDTQDPLRDLGQRLDKARRGQLPPPSDGDSEAQNALAVGLRIGLELVVAVFVGAGLGWAFDNWLGTGPWGLIVFIFLGFAAGVLNVFRIAIGAERAVGFGAKGQAPRPPQAWDDDEE
jgi:ATP synthase protein I